MNKSSILSRNIYETILRASIDRQTKKISATNKVHLLLNGKIDHCSEGLFAVPKTNVNLDQTNYYIKHLATFLKTLQIQFVITSSNSEPIDVKPGDISIETTDKLFLEKGNGVAVFKKCDFFKLDEIVLDETRCEEFRYKVNCKNTKTCKLALGGTKNQSNLILFFSEQIRPKIGFLKQIRIVNLELYFKYHMVWLKFTNTTDR